MFPRWELFRQQRTRFLNVDPTAVQNLASKLRDGVPCTVTDDFESGSENVAFRIHFIDDVEWIGRVLGEEAALGDLSIVTRNKLKIHSSVATMQYVRSKSSIPVPRVYAFDDENTSPGLGAGWIMMECMSGFLVDETPGALSMEDEIQVYHQLAQITTQLSNLRFPQIGLICPDDAGHFRVGEFVDAQGLGYGPFDTSVHYFKHRVEEIVCNIETWIYRQNFESKEEKENAAKMCRLFEKVANKLSDHNDGSFPLTHGDLGTNNVLFQRDLFGQLKITAVLDWDHAHASSWLDFGQFPTMLEIDWPALEAEEYSPMVLDTLRRRQQIYLDGIRKYEDKRQSPLLSSIIDSPAVRVVEFFFLYSDPEGNMDPTTFSKYIAEWQEMGEWRSVQEMGEIAEDPIVMA